MQHEAQRQQLTDACNRQLADARLNYGRSLLFEVRQRLNDAEGWQRRLAAIGETCEVARSCIRWALLHEQMQHWPAELRIATSSQAKPLLRESSPEQQRRIAQRAADDTGEPPTATSLAAAVKAIKCEDQQARQKAAGRLTAQDADLIAWRDEWQSMLEHFTAAHRIWRKLYRQPALVALHRRGFFHDAEARLNKINKAIEDTHQLCRPIGPAFIRRVRPDVVYDDEQGRRKLAEELRKKQQELPI